MSKHWVQVDYANHGERVEVEAESAAEARQMMRDEHPNAVSIVSKRGAARLLHVVDDSDAVKGRDMTDGEA